MKKKDLNNQSLNQKEKIKSNLNNFAKYSSLSAQMIVIVLAGAFGGIKLDAFLKWRFPIFTLIFSILGVSFAIYVAIKDFLR